MLQNQPSLAKWAIPLIMSFLLTSCGYLSEDPQQQAEQSWLAQDEQLNAAINQIREQGINAVVASAEAGSVASCVAQNLQADPLGALVTVEGALAESAQIATLLNDLQGLLQEDLSFEQMSDLLQKSAKAAAYAKEMISQQGVEQALQSLKNMATASQAYASQDLGGHLKQVLKACSQTEIPASAEKAI